MIDGRAHLSTRTPRLTRARSDPTRWGLPGILIAAIIIRFSTLSLQSYWNDEAATVALVRRSLGSMLAVIPNKERTPFVYYVVAWGWSRLFGSGELGLRSLSALCGTLTVLCAFLVARRLGGHRAGLIAAALTTVSPILVWYSQEARSYAMLGLLCVASVWLWLRVQDSRSDRAVLAWGLVSCLAIATHYFASFIVVFEALFLIRAVGRKRVLVTTLGVLAAVQLALIPLALHQAQAQQSGDYITATSLQSRVIAVPERFLLGEHGAPTPTERDLFSLALVILVCIVGWLFATRTGALARRRTLPVLVIAVLALALPLVLALLGVDFFAYRNLLAVWVLLLIVGAVGLGASAGWASHVATFGLSGIFLLLTIAVNVTPSLQRADWRFAPQALGRPHWKRLIVVAPFFDEGVFRIYVPSARFADRRRVTVREIDLVGYRLPPGRTPPRAPARFRVASIVNHQKLSFVRYVAPRATTVDVLRVPGLLAPTRAFLIQPAPAR
jgi:mannosyltransferase